MNLFSLVAIPVVLAAVARPARVERGNTGQCVLDPIDTAAWISHPACTNDAPAAPARFVRFSKRFVSDGTPLAIDVSADERCVLFLDGRFVGRAPEFGWTEHWIYRSYEIALEKGEHELVAVVTRLKDAGPIAQFSYRGGFILKAEGAYDAQLTTGRATWRCGLLKGTRMAESFPAEAPWGGPGREAFVTGTGYESELPDAWTDAAVVLPGMTKKTAGAGLRRAGWMLFPSTMPAQIERLVRPGVIREGNFTLGKLARFAPHAKVSLAWDLGNYWCGFPRLSTRGGRGAKVVWRWVESLRDANGRKGNRAEWKGKRFASGVADTFLPDGRADARFTTPWWRCGRWCELVIETGDEPLEITDLAIAESRYPLEAESRFSAPDDPSLAAVERICLRGAQMCAHETLMDCPYYEQQMYPGDTRVQLLILTALSSDVRMIRRAIELYDLSRRDDGLIAMNFPTRHPQESTAYSLCYALMLGDYVLWHGDDAWLRARFPGFMNTMFAFERQERADGLLGDTFGWPFIDWVGAPWRSGNHPDRLGEGGNAIENLFYVLALQSAARTCRALGKADLAVYWDVKARRTGEAVMFAFWDETRGMVADTRDHALYSEHAQALAILADVAAGGRLARLRKNLLEAKDLARCTVYFRHYLFEAYAKIGRADLILKKLDLWRAFVASGMSTPKESPDGPTRDSRSDCHAWGSHPIFHLRASVAGIRPASAFFETVRVAPQPGDLKTISATMPHPNGPIAEELSFDGKGGVTGTVTLPAGLVGTFEYGKTVQRLYPGTNAVGKVAGRAPMPVLLSFDDNVKEHATFVAPELARRGWRGVFNFVAGRIPDAGSETALGWDDVRGILAGGHAVANHSLTHPNFGPLLRNGETNEVRRQIWASRDLFREKTGLAPTWFCYPGNWCNDFTHALVEEAGMRPYRWIRRNFGYRTPSGTPQGVRAFLLRRIAAGDAETMLMVHGTSRGRGWLPFETRADFLAFLDEIAALEREGWIRVADVPR